MIEKFSEGIKVLEEWNYFDYHKDRRQEAKMTLKREIQKQDYSFIIQFASRIIKPKK